MTASRPATDSAIAIDHLTKRYGTVTALDDVTLTVPPGIIYGFLGPNGAGKTTTIKTLLGFIKPTAGQASIFGHECWRDGVRARRNLGFLVQPDQLFPDLSGRDHLTFAAQLSGRKPVARDRLLEALELSAAALGRKLGSYSKGMKQKLALVAAMQHEPELLILDEPTDGLDPLIQRNFEELLLDLRACGRTIFMSSHDLAEVERTCERIAVVRGGKLVAEETVAGLKRLHRRRAEVIFRHAPPPGIISIPNTRVIARDGQSVTLLLEADVNPLLTALAGYEITDLTITPPGLDDIFMGFYDQPNGTTVSTERVTA